MAPANPTDFRSDHQLIDDLNHNDPSAFTELYHRYRDWVGRLAIRFTGNSDDALDVLQETFTYVFRKFPGFHLTSAMTTFLYPVVKNIALAHRRRRRPVLTDDEQLFADLPAPIDSNDFDPAELRIALSDLPDPQREVLLMRFLDEMSLEQIAQTLHIPLGTVKSRLHNALETLRDSPAAQKYFLSC